MYSVLWESFFLISTVVGYFIFRGANSQKNEFRKDPFNSNLARK